ncbi:MAG: type II toxin-antitoxin system RelE/ParE family toxin [Planctomycetes bacterium]|nr:type II toxin-antitoxin system RelE/ParE family toxin [Planctomycetota bacterium]
MTLALERSAPFNLDFEREFRWYLGHAGADVAGRFLDSMLATLRMLASQPESGRRRKFRHPALRDLRSVRVRRPFHKILIFYRLTEDTVQAWRLMHGARDLPRRLSEPPGSGT